MCVKCTSEQKRKGYGGLEGGFSNQIDRRTGGMQGAGSMYSPFMSGLVGGEYENPDRIFTGQITNLLTGGGGGGGGGGYGNYGIESTCPEGVNQNTALLATAAAIAVGAGVIYRAVTLQQGKRRRRREVDTENKEGETGVMEMVMNSIKKYRDIDL